MFRQRNETGRRVVSPTGLRFHRINQSVDYCFGWFFSTARRSFSTWSLSSFNCC